MNDKNRSNPLTGQMRSFKDAAWVLAVGGQAGLMLAVPVLLGLAAGYLLDRSFGSLPWITLLFTLIGIVIGPIMVYRWVTRTVQNRTSSKMTTVKENGT